MRINFIYLVLFLIFCITIFNVYYKQQWYAQSKRNAVSLDAIPFAFSPFDKLFCPINGFKCPDETCDCAHYCKGNYEKLHIYDDEHVVLFHEKLKAGTYCLPKGALKCHLKSSIPVYSVNAWTCIPRNTNVWKNNHFVACKSPYAKDNGRNILYDHKTGKQASTAISNFYEMHNGRMRYQCRCDSKDFRGNKMIALDQVPFTCVADYCLSNIDDNNRNIGWRVDRCDCGPYGHENPRDDTSPCIQTAVGLKDSTFTGFTKCTNTHSVDRQPIHCNKNYFTFQKEMTFDNYARDFLKKQIK